MAKSKSKWIMRCGSNCGVFSRGGSTQSENIKDALTKGFKQIGKLWYCPRCAKKKEAGQQQCQLDGSQ